MGEFEEKYIYPEIGDDCLYYGRYIDDILMIFKGNVERFKIFAERLNTKHPSIKFDYEVSKKSISFLDTRIYIDENQSPENITVARSLTGGRLVKQWKFGGRFVKIEI